MYTLRALRRSPWYSAAVIAVIGLAISIATTVFAIVDGVLFKPLPYSAPSQLHRLFGTVQGQTLSVSSPDLRDWRRAVPEASFSAFIVLGRETFLPSSSDRVEPLDVTIASVDEEFFLVLDPSLLIGGFGGQDFTAPPAIRPIVISHALWRSVFGGKPDLVGTIVPTESKVDHRIVGVLRRDFVFPDTGMSPDVLAPLRLDVATSENRRARRLKVIARRPDELSVREFSDRLDGVTRTSATYASDPFTRLGAFDGVKVTSLKTHLEGRSRNAFLIIATAAVLLVFLACANVSGLCIARHEDRRRDLSLRLALGASRRALFLMVFRELLVLALIAGVIGVLGSQFLLRVALTLWPVNVPLLKIPEVDLRVLAFAFGASVVATFLTALPVVRVVGRVRLAGALAEGAYGASSGKGLVRRVLIAAQVALALTLVLGGTLIVGSLSKVWREPTGFEAREIVHLEVDLGPGDGARKKETLAALLRELERLPTVRSAAACDMPFLENAIGGSPFRLPPGAVQDGFTELVPVSSRFFEVTGVSPVAGRLPTPQEVDAARPLAVVSERVANAYWPGKQAVGQVLDGSIGPYAVTGIVKGARYQSLDRTSPGEIYIPMTTVATSRKLTILVRASGSPAATVNQVLASSKQMPHGIRIQQARSATDSLAESIRPRRFRALMFGMFAVSGLVITGTGLFGVVAMITTKRIKELGIRVALGATPSRVVRSVVLEQFAPAVVGVLVGSLGGFWVARVLQRYLYQLSPYDPAVWIGAVVTVILVAAGASWVPATLAMRHDPVRLLREE